MNEGLQYGYGVFETIRFQNAQAQSLPLHYNRMTESAQALDIAQELAYSDFHEKCHMAIKQSGLETGALRCQLSKNGSDSIMDFQVRPIQYTIEHYKRGYRLGVSEVYKNSQSQLTRHKSVNYLENLLALRVGRQQGFDEVLIRNDQGFITEGTHTNIFGVKGRVLYTPDASCGLLEGTMRRQVIMACENAGLEVRETKMYVETLISMEEIFLTNALVGIMPVSAFESEAYGMDVKRLELSDNGIAKQLTDLVMSDWII